MNKTIRCLIFFLISFGVVSSKTLSEIEGEIASAQQNITKKQNDQGALQSKIDKLSKEIVGITAELKQLDKQIEANKKEIDGLLKIVSAQRGERERLTNERGKLLAEKERIDGQLANLLMKHTAQSIVLDGSDTSNEEDIVKETMFYIMKERVKNESVILKTAYNSVSKDIEAVESKIAAMLKNLDDLTASQEVQKELYKKQTQLLANLDKQKSSYLSQLETLIDHQNRERQLLADLNIVRQKTVDQMRQAQLDNRVWEGADALSVKHYGSSFQNAGNSRYDGKKVKAPLDSIPISIVKEFGPYTDPIYNIKIHNDSVTLRPNDRDALVRSVLPGKVVFADNLKLLGKVVIIEHRDNIHTIYRNLESISPNIRIDRSLKERESVGRVNTELVFEVTKDGLPINPLQLILL
ncbi:MAG: peptidoglycan DD-metalloendopeptidase family protein [Helicobacteraceae bacterium]|jgi:septal ring factor EnvC (AmiA/AmiB activator)|nr:peptidoglycan DD-metalloendopeptidase family protein [Helicobacteraceae bacterium]